MGVTVIVPAGNALLTTRETVKTELGIADAETTDDIIISDLIVRASSAIARECRRVFGVETVTETLDGTGSRILGLSRYPIVEVTEVTEDGAVITDYSIEDADAGALYRANGWGRSGGLRMWGAEAYASGYTLPGYQDQRYAVTYRAGYLLPSDVNEWILPDATLQNLPGAVEQACLETVKAWYLGRGADPSMAVASVRVRDMQVTYRDASSSSTPPGTLPPSALGLLRQYYQMFR